jgi:hypothetical protein
MGKLIHKEDKELAQRYIHTLKMVELNRSLIGKSLCLRLLGCMTKLGLGFVCTACKPVSSEHLLGPCSCGWVQVHSLVLQPKHCPFCDPAIWGLPGSTSPCPAAPHLSCLSLWPTSFNLHGNWVLGARMSVSWLGKDAAREGGGFSHAHPRRGERAGPIRI